MAIAVTSNLKKMFPSDKWKILHKDEVDGLEVIEANLATTTGEVTSLKSEVSVNKAAIADCDSKVLQNTSNIQGLQDAIGKINPTGFSTEAFLDNYEPTSSVLAANAAGKLKLSVSGGGGEGGGGNLPIIANGDAGKIVAVKADLSGYELISMTNLIPPTPSDYTIDLQANEQITFSSASRSDAAGSISKQPDYIDFLDLASGSVGDFYIHDKGTRIRYPEGLKTKSKGIMSIGFSTSFNNVLPESCSYFIKLDLYYVKKGVLTFHKTISNVVEEVVDLKGSASGGVSGVATLNFDIPDDIPTVAGDRGKVTIAILANCGTQWSAGTNGYQWSGGSINLYTKPDTKFIQFKLS